MDMLGPGLSPGPAQVYKGYVCFFCVGMPHPRPRRQLHSIDQVLCPAPGHHAWCPTDRSFCCTYLIQPLCHGLCNIPFFFLAQNTETWTVNSPAQPLPLSNLGHCIVVLVALDNKCDHSVPSPLNASYLYYLLFSSNLYPQLNEDMRQQ